MKNMVKRYKINRSGFKDSVIWNKLYQFQKDGVMGLIRKLEKYNGAILADSVGLGKTFSALAVIKYFELQRKRVLWDSSMTTKSKSDHRKVSSLIPSLSPL